MQYQTLSNVNDVLISLNDTNEFERVLMAHFALYTLNVVSPGAADFSSDKLEFPVDLFTDPESKDHSRYFKVTGHIESMGMHTLSTALIIVGIVDPAPRWSSMYVAFHQDASDEWVASEKVIAVPSLSEPSEGTWHLAGRTLAEQFTLLTHP